MEILTRNRDSRACPRVARRYVRFLGRADPAAVKLGAAALPPVNGAALGSAQSSAYAYDAASRSVIVKVFVADVSGARNGAAVLAVS